VWCFKSPKSWRFAWVALLLLGPAAATFADTPPLPVINTGLIYDVTNTAFAGGALGDGVSNSAAAIQAAINFASTASASGATVRLPAVGTYTNYISGPIALRSHVNLQVDAGAMLQMYPLTTWQPNYGTTTFIEVGTITDAEISGLGTIDGQGTNWWATYPSDTGSRPHFIQIDHCTRVLVRDVTLQNPPVFTVYMKNGNDTSVTIDHITINTPFDSHNTDGFDITATNVVIQNCFISTGDDDVEIGGSNPLRDLTISNCTFGTGHGVSMGSSIKGGVSGVIVSNCSWNNTEYGIKIKSDDGSGSFVQNITYCDMTMTNVNFPIAFYMDYATIGSPITTFPITPANAAADSTGSITSTTPIYRNITISNLTAVGNNGIQGPGNVACFMYGKPESPVTNVTLTKVNILGRNNGDGTFCLYHVRGIQFIDCNLTAPTSGTNTLTLCDAQITITNSVSSTNLVTIGGLATASDPNTLSFFNALAAVTDTNALQAGSIALGSSTLTFTQGSASVGASFGIVNPSTVVVTSGTNSFSGALGGTGPLTLNLIGGSLLSVLGDSTGFGGALTVSNGTLLVDNTTGTGTGTGPVTVATTASVGGNGVIGGPLTVNGAFVPGNNGAGTLTMSSDLTTASGATLSYALGAGSSLAVVGGNLALDGTLNITDAGGFTTGAYTLFNYGGTLTTNGSPSILAIGSVPNTNFSYVVDISSNGYVMLFVFTPPVAAFTAAPTTGTVPLAVTFTDNSTGTITNRFWDFGDGTTTNTLATNVQHVYTLAGTDTVQLIVSGPGAVSTNTQVGEIIANAPVCTNTLSATSANFGILGGPNTVMVTSSDVLCPWTATSDAGWIQITGGSVATMGSAVVAYTVLPNTASSSTRIGTMTIAGQTFTVTQVGDTVLPTVTLISAPSGIVSRNSTLSATATDNVSVARVEFYRDGGVLLGSFLAPPYQMTLDTTALSDGRHCFYVEAYDPAGNVGSSSNSCAIVDNNSPTAPTGLTATAVSTNQINLSWTPSTDDGSGVAGYQVTRGGSLFANTTATSFSDSGLATATRYCYTVAAVDFVGHVSAGSQVCAQTLGPASAMLGIYNGLVMQSAAPSHASSGSIQITVGKSMSFAARLTIGGARASFKGRFDSSGNATNTIKLAGGNSALVALHGLPDGTDQITGTVSNSEFVSALLADRQTYSTQNPCPFAGGLTMVLAPPSGNNPAIPQGFGYGTLSVMPTGLGRLRGVLGDGTRVTAMTPVSKHGTIPFYVPCYGKQGASIGWLTFVNNTTIQATVDWFKPATPTSAFYPHGFATNVTLSGDVFVSPANNGPSPAGTRQVTLAGGNLIASIVETAVVNSAGSVLVSGPNAVNLQMKFNPTSGQFSGSFTHPALNKTVDFNGSYLQLDGSGAGLFFGTNETGSVVLELLQ